MPLYEYQCTKCRHRFERIQKFSDPLVTKCPECGGKVEQLLSAPAVQFKGSGWYVTDYGKGGSSKPSTSSDSPSKAESTAVEAAGDGAKPADSSTEKPKKTKAKKHE